MRVYHVRCFLSSQPANVVVVHQPAGYPVTMQHSTIMTTQQGYLPQQGYPPQQSYPPQQGYPPQQPYPGQQPVGVYPMQPQQSADGPPPEYGLPEKPQ